MSLETRECPFCGKRFLVAVDNTDESRPEVSKPAPWWFFVVFMLVGSGLVFWGRILWMWLRGETW